MIEIGGKPILWHIMKTVRRTTGSTTSSVCLGYRGYVIKEYFANYYLHTARRHVRPRRRTRSRSTQPTPNRGRVTLVDTGEATMTGGRLKRVQHYVERRRLLLHLRRRRRRRGHRRARRLPRESGNARDRDGGAAAGALRRARDRGRRVTRLHREAARRRRWINGGFFVLSPEVVDHIEGDETVWEREPLEAAGADGQLMAYEHPGFWQPMDTLRDKTPLEELWASGHGAVAAAGRARSRRPARTFWRGRTPSCPATLASRGLAARGQARIAYVEEAWRMARHEPGASSSTVTVLARTPKGAIWRGATSQRPRSRVSVGALEPRSTAVGPLADRSLVRAGRRRLLSACTRQTRGDQRVLRAR